MLAQLASYHLDEPILDRDSPTSFLPAPNIIEYADLERKSIGIDDSANIERGFIKVEEERKVDLEDFNLEDIEIENINLGKEREAHVKDVSVERGDKADVEDVNLEDLSVEGGDKVDVEDIHIEYVNRLANRGFGDIGKNKATKYAGKLGGYEKYLDSSNCWSEDSEEIDVDIVRRVDLPRRRRIKKTRYDENCNFIVKNYNPIHKCIPLNKNKTCDSKLVARKFKDRIVSQPYIRIWEIQDLVSNVAGRGQRIIGKGQGAAGRGKGGSGRDGGSGRGQCGVDGRGSSGRGQYGVDRESEVGTGRG
ncbi:hypothetical protein T459_21623 [Capsicum annuum]|uniref:Uncharacterized protein n=1 Tax=Capsicum annuum TaxID=4072 RepID=A0A2G2YX79_CAPAN|nr:hypothetical protein T459_21623 [Capsicum annuum]